MAGLKVSFNHPDNTNKERRFLADAISNGHSSGNGVFTKKVEALTGDTISVTRALLTTSCTHAL